jgi:hypothetical protein
MPKINLMCADAAPFPQVKTFNPWHSSCMQSNVLLKRTLLMSCADAAASQLF